MVAPGGGLCRGPLRSRAAHPAGATLDEPSGPHDAPATAPGRPLPSLAHFSGDSSHQGGPATFQDSPPAPIPQPQPKIATPSHRSPCPKKHRAPIPQQQGRPASRRSAHHPAILAQRRRPAKAASYQPPPPVIATVSGTPGCRPEKGRLPASPGHYSYRRLSPTAGTASHPFATPLNVCRFLNPQHGGFHAQANAQSSSSAHQRQQRQQQPEAATAAGPHKVPAASRRASRRPIKKAFKGAVRPGRQVGRVAARFPHGRRLQAQAAGYRGRGGRWGRQPLQALAQPRRLAGRVQGTPAFPVPHHQYQVSIGHY